MIAIGLHYEYRFILKQLEQSKQQYQSYAQFFEQQMMISMHHEFDNKETDTTIKPFLVVNRNTEYLKKNAYDYATHQETKGLNAEFLSKKERFISAKKTTQKRLFQKKVIKPGLLCWPVEQSLFWLSSRFGPRKKESGTNGFHHGIDMAASRGTLVKAAALGVVIEATYNRGYGKTIVIAHADGYYQTRYAHLDEIIVKRGQRVTSGQKIGTVGDTGSVRGENGGKNAYHLHFEVKLRGKHIDPLRVLPV